MSDTKIISIFQIENQDSNTHGLSGFSQNQGATMIFPQQVKKIHQRIIQIKRMIFCERSV